MNARVSSSFEYATSIKSSQIKIDFLLGGNIGVIYTGDAGDMSPPLFEMADFVPTTF